MINDSAGDWGHGYKSIIGALRYRCAVC